MSKEIEVSGIIEKVIAGVFVACIVAAGGLFVISAMLREFAEKMF